MPVPRGLIPPALIASLVGLLVCSIAWGAFGVFSFTEPNALPTTAHRYLSMMLATFTILSMMVYLTARVLRTIHAVMAERATETVCGYAEGYTDGLSAAPVSPAVARLTPTRR